MYVLMVSNFKFNADFKEALFISRVTARFYKHSSQITKSPRLRIRRYSWISQMIVLHEDRTRERVASIAFGVTLTIRQ